MGGGNAAAFSSLRWAFGLSPRGRGKLVPRLMGGAQLGSIPAWAGETIVGRRVHLMQRVYPRVGGGNGGSRSPRRLSLGSIPAWAGETRGNRPAGCGSRVYPRVGGGNWSGSNSGPIWKGLSPRGRGKRPLPVLGWQRRRSIPAWAGETRRFQEKCRAEEVYPRVGGGNGPTHAPAVEIGGLSPRGRGKLSRTGSGGRKQRSIPAWAGETR